MAKPLGPPPNKGLFSRVMAVSKGYKGPAKVKPKRKGGYKPPGFPKAPNLERNLRSIITDTSSDPDSSSAEDPWESLTKGLCKKDLTRLNKKMRFLANQTFEDKEFQKEVDTFIEASLDRMNSTIQESNLLTQELISLIQERADQLPISLACQLNKRERPILGDRISSYRKIIAKHFRDLAETYDRYVANGHIIPETRRSDGELFVRRTLKAYLNPRAKS